MTRVVGSLAILLPEDLRLSIRPNHSLNWKSLMDKETYVVQDIVNRLITYRVEERIYEEDDIEEEELRGQDCQNTSTKGKEEEDEAIECVRDSLISPIAQKLPNFEAHDPMLEVNLGTADKPKMTKISGLLAEPEREQLTALITNYKDCFAWDYHEIPGLSKRMVEHIY